MASTQGKVLFNAESLSATTTSEPKITMAKDVNHIAYLKIENNASANFAIKIQHSPDNVNYFDLVTFVATGGNTTEKINIDNTTDHVFEHVRAVATRTAGSADFTIILHYDRA